MSTQTLSRLTIETMANYRTAATQMVAATGAGSRRLVRLVDGTVQHQVLPRATRVAPRSAERLEAVGSRLSQLSQWAEQGIDQAQQRAEAGIARSSEFAIAQLGKWADRAAELQAPVLSGGLDAAATFSLPAANLGLLLSGKLAEGATQLADAAGAHPVAKTVRKAGAKVRKQAGTAARRARKAAAPVVEAPAVKRARRAVKKAAA
ncbi:MAG: hypothetical protein QM750_09635 [Rubrivivax sp.]